MQENVSHCLLHTFYHYDYPHISGKEEDTTRMLWGCVPLVVMVVMASMTIMERVFLCLWLVSVHIGWGILLVKMWKKIGLFLIDYIEAKCFYPRLIPKGEQYIELFLHTLRALEGKSTLRDH
jgi:hypothetical protein